MFVCLGVGYGCGGCAGGCLGSVGLLGEIDMQLHFPRERGGRGLWHSVRACKYERLPGASGVGGGRGGYLWGSELGATPWCLGYGHGGRGRGCLRSEQCFGLGAWTCMLKKLLVLFEPWYTYKQCSMHRETTCSYCAHGLIS